MVHNAIYIGHCIIVNVMPPADPTADVGGWDAQAKLLLITKLAYGVTLTSSEVPTVGITEITLLSIAAMYVHPA